MDAVCKKCKRPVHGKFQNGHYIFKHCGSVWKKNAKFHGRPEVRNDGAKIGAAIGGLVGMANGDIGGNVGIAVGTALGKLFDTDNGINCYFCSGRRAYPTGRYRNGKKQYQCNACKRFILK